MVQFHLLGVLTLPPFFRLLIGFLPALSLGTAMVPEVSAVPLENALDKGQAQNYLEMNRPWDEAPPLYHNINPHLTDGINEPHPMPAYIKRKTYNQLLNIAPVNQVQSKIFNSKLFDGIQRIGVLGFENKTFALFEDKSAGEVVSQQAYHELKTNKNYSNVIPPQMMEDARFKIVKTPDNDVKEKQSNSYDGLKPELVSTDAVDAILVGAVTKYSNRYRDRRGNIKQGIASGLEFSVFLVDPRNQEVIWGARFVGSQKQGLRNLARKKGGWLNKEGFTRLAMKYVLKDFRNRD